MPAITIFEQAPLGAPIRYTDGSTNGYGEGPMEVDVQLRNLEPYASPDDLSNPSSPRGNA